jgi:uncharacterized membrane protein
MAGEPILFEALIVPHRSLTAQGLRRLIGVICLLSGLIALRFLLIRAWPVLGFSVVEVALAVVLLRVNASRGRQAELLILSEASLSITRSDARGRRRERVLCHDWLKVLIDEQPGRVPRLLLAARGVCEEIGASLGETEKRDLAAALRDALHRLRNPEFDNPQLHE